MEKTAGAHHPCIRTAFTTTPAVTEPATASTGMAKRPAEEMPAVPPDGAQDIVATVEFRALVQRRADEQKPSALPPAGLS
ncbi:hypothetical protein GCM10023083_41470 [Streptomyces phyllanthi]